MNNNLTKIVFILDRSGSMQHLAQDTIGGFNSFIEGQKKIPGEAVLTTILFDDEYEVLHANLNIHDVPPLTEEQYYARGMTALLDAVGKTIKNVGEELSKISEEERPGKVIFVITTDGVENSSKEFKTEIIKNMIEHQQTVYNWTFLFLGANIDSLDTANNIGINSRGVANYSASPVGTQSLYMGVSAAVDSVRISNNGTLCKDWSKGIV